MFTLLKRQDWLLNLSLVFLAVSSLVIFYSINPVFFWRQIVWFLLGLIIIFGFSLADWRSLMSYQWLILTIYFLTVLLLIVTLIFAPAIRNTRSWLEIGSIRFQASEFAKAALILILSYFFARKHFAIANWRVIFKSFVYFVVPAGLVLLQPDLGSTLIFFGIWLGFLLISGIPWRYIFAGIIILIIVSFLAWNYFLADYQKKRIQGLFNPDYDPLGINYSVIQSKIAIGSAGFLGKGFNQGTQVQLGFLPEAQNDFVFAAFVEEWGFLGGFLLVAAFNILLFRIIKIGLNAQNNFLRFICLGSFIVFSLEFFFNVSSNLGLLPVVGISVPFLSYGGSNLLSSAILIGIIQGIATHSTFLKD